MERRDSFSADSIRAALETDFIGRELFFFDRIGSTNEAAYKLALEGAAEGTAVVADSQAGGKGRRGRYWFSPEGVNLYTSLVLRPAIAPALASRLTLVAAVALAQTITSLLEGSCKKRGEIKWPNDILVEGRKCAGILTEMRAEGAAVDFVILGVGLNLNMKRGGLPEEISGSVTSLSEEAGRPFERAPAVAAFFRYIEEWYTRYLREGFPPVQEEWNRHSAINGRRVKAACSEEGYEEGVALGIDGEGALLLKREDGDIVRVWTGDVLC